ncbi:Uncharacterised protein [Halioglobus japonicus]|nr:Uncharacterised protein [Halioglobus japonicus]
MLKVLRWIIIFAILLLLLGVVSLGALFLYALEEKPSVPRSAPADYTTVAEGKAFVKRIKLEVESAGEEGATLVLTEHELDRLAQIASHTFKWLNSDFDIAGAAINSRASVQLPDNPFGEYLNLGAQVLPSSDGIVIEQLSVGPLRYSGRWLLPLAAQLADLLTRQQQASLILEGVSDIQIEGDSVVLSVAPPPDVKAHLKEAVRTLQAYRLPAGEAKRVTHYYDLLVALGARSNGGSESFSEYLTPVVAEAQRRSERGYAVEENRAALWALIIYFSNGGFEVLIGKLVSSERALVRSSYDITLAGRRDLMAHFISSAAIALASQQGISIAAGEFKELLDSGYGGSGFSFADLAADRAGIQFVSLATGSEAQARQWQEQLLANAGEVGFFPDISGLVEGLSDEEFRRQYGEIDSQRYLQQVARIDQRIARAAIYKSAGGNKNSDD